MCVYSYTHIQTSSHVKQNTNFHRLKFKNINRLLPLRKKKRFSNAFIMYLHNLIQNAEMLTFRHFFFKEICVVEVSFRIFPATYQGTCLVLTNSRHPILLRIRKQEGCSAHTPTTVFYPLKTRLYGSIRNQNHLIFSRRKSRFRTDLALKYFILSTSQEWEPVKIEAKLKC